MFEDFHQVTDDEVRELLATPTVSRLTLVAWRSAIYRLLPSSPAVVVHLDVSASVAPSACARASSG